MSIIDRDAYLMQCCRYVELNPVKAMMVGKAEDYEWSSYREKLGIDCADVVDYDECYLRLKNPGKAYREFVEQGISEKRAVIYSATS